MKKMLFSCILMLGISLISSASNSITNLPVNNEQTDDNNQVPPCTIQLTSSCGQTWNVWMSECTWESIIENMEYIEHICELEEPQP